MGAFRAKFKMGEREVDLLFLQYNFERRTDAKSRVSSRTQIGSGGLKMRYEVTENSAFLEQMLNKEHHPIETATVTFINTHDEAEMRTITITNSFITGFQETFDFDNDQPHTALITLHAEEMAIGNASIHNGWPVA